LAAGFPIFPAGKPFSTFIFLHFWSIKNYDIISFRYCLHVLSIVIFKIFLSLKMWKISLQHYRKCKLKPETVSYDLNGDRRGIIRCLAWHRTMPDKRQELPPVKSDVYFAWADENEKHEQVLLKFVQSLASVVFTSISVSKSASVFFLTTCFFGGMMAIFYMNAYITARKCVSSV